LLLLTLAVRFASAIHFLSDLEHSHELMSADHVDLKNRIGPLPDPFLHHPHSLREPLYVWHAAEFAIKATKYVLRYRDQEEHNVPGNRNYDICAGHIERLQRLVGTPNPEA
jgi:hypothetical protein